MTNLDLAGGGAAATVGGIGWFVWGVLVAHFHQYDVGFGIVTVGVAIATIGLIMVGLAPNDNMALGPEDLDE